MIKIPFLVSARAGKLFGRENFSNPEGAISELVKNSYDADAKNCLVFFDIPYIIEKDHKGNEKKIFVKEKSQIFIVDNGEGMTKNVIENQWMKIGTGNKDTDYISEGNRIKTGAKGIGRFALDRLGFTSEMWTLSKKSNGNSGYNWKMDWKQFDNSDKSISEITAELSEDNIDISSLIKSSFKNNKIIYKLLDNIDFHKGTVLKISNLKDDWNDDEIETVFKNLEALIPPKELNIPFDVNFQHIQEPKEYGKVETAFFNDYDYKLNAMYDAEKLSVIFEITRNELDVNLIKKKFTDLYKNTKYPFDLTTIEGKVFRFSKPIDQLLRWNLDERDIKHLKDVGSFNLTFYYLKFNVSKKEEYPFKSINTKERKSVLDKFGGVKIYRDSFRVRPYGDPTNDWLKLGARVAQSPAGAGQRIGDWRVRPEQTAGIITISRKSNSLLLDKSDRGGLQENETLEIFKNIIIAVIHEFEFDRTKVLNVFYKHFKKEKEKEKELEIQNRAEYLADKIVAERKNVEEKFYGKNNHMLDLFQQKKEEEEKKAYEKTFKDTLHTFSEDKNEKENEEIVQVRALASLGLIVSSFAHELKEIRNNATEIKSLEKIYKSLIVKELKKSDEYKDGIDIIELLEENSKKIKHWVDYSLTAIKKDKRQRGSLSFSSYFKELGKSWLKIFKSKEINFAIIDCVKGMDYDFRAFEMDMNTIFTNLINNSIDSFNNQDEIQERNISVKVELIKNVIDITYSDNGNGLSDVFLDKEDIFLPFTTSKTDREGNDIGIGLGMYLVKNVVDDNNGNINILEPKKGFAVSISFPTRKT